MIGPVVELLAEVRSLRIKLIAEGDRLRFAPRDRLPAELVGRLKAHKPEVIAALSATERPTGEYPNALQARRREATTPDELQVVEPNNASTNAVAIAEPKPCPTCGSAIYWLAPSGATTCPDCEARPGDAVKVVIITKTGGSTTLEPFVRRRP